MAAAVKRAGTELRKMTKVERKLTSTREALRRACEKGVATSAAKLASELRLMEAKFADSVSRIRELLVPR